MARNTKRISLGWKEIIPEINFGLKKMKGIGKSKYLGKNGKLFPF